MIWTREQTHHSTGNVPSCPAHPAFTARRCLAVRTSGKEKGSGFVSVQASASLHRQPQSSRPSAREQQALASQAGTQSSSPLGGRGSARSRALPSRGRTCGSAWKEKATLELREGLAAGREIRGCGTRTGGAQANHRGNVL